MRKIFAQRLKSARIMSGYSLQELADRADNIISKQALNKYEQGLMLPGSKVMIKLAAVLNVKPDYLFKEKEISLEKIEFRKRAKLGKKIQNSIKEKTKDFLERFHDIELLLNSNIKFTSPIENLHISSFSEVETAANELRKSWDLGFNPIPNVIEMLEIRGVKIFEIDVSNHFDGLSTIVNNSPVIVLNKNIDNVRKRFTSLHELGHLLLSFSSLSENKDIEKLCHSFAGAILIPGKNLIKHLGEHRTKISMQELLDLKRYYGISIQAIMARALNLNIISAHQYKLFNIYFSRMKYRKNEPGDYLGSDEPLRFNNMVYRAFSEKIITASKASSLLNVKMSELQENFKVF